MQQSIIGAYYSTQEKALEKLREGETIVKIDTGWLIVKDNILKLIK